MEIRAAEGPSDVRGAVRVNRAAWTTAYADILPEDAIRAATQRPDDADVADRFERIRGRDGAFLIAAEDGDVVGYTYLRWGADTSEFVGEEAAELRELYVHPDEWRRGVGTALLEAAVDRLPPSVERVALETLAGNEAGQRFYESRGFERVDAGEFRAGDRTYPTVRYAARVD